jgi:hypothetical protein
MYLEVLDKLFQTALFGLFGLMRLNVFSSEIDCACVTVVNKQTNSPTSINNLRITTSWVIIMIVNFLQ